VKEIDNFYNFNLDVAKNNLRIHFFLFISCKNFGQLNTLADLPNELKEVSGTKVLTNSNFIWMINDGGNKSTL